MNKNTTKSIIVCAALFFLFIGNYLNAGTDESKNFEGLFGAIIKHEEPNGQTLEIRSNVLNKSSGQGFTTNYFIENDRIIISRITVGETKNNIASVSYNFKAWDYRPAFKGQAEILSITAKATPKVSLLVDGSKTLLKYEGAYDSGLKIESLAGSYQGSFSLVTNNVLQPRGIFYDDENISISENGGFEHKVDNCKLRGQLYYTGKGYLDLTISSNSDCNLIELGATWSGAAWLDTLGNLIMTSFNSGHNNGVVIISKKQ